MLKGKLSSKKIIPFLIVGVGLLFVLAALTGIDKIVESISQIDKEIYALAFVAQVTAIAVWLVKWRVITRAIDLEVRTRRMFPILLSGIFVNTAVPSAKIGGEPLRAYMFSKLGGISMDKSFATVAADRAVDGIPFIVIVLASLVYVLFSGSLPLYATILIVLASILVCVGVVSFLYVCLRPEPAKGFVQWLIRKLRRIIRKFRPISYVEKKAEEFMEGFGSGAQKIFSNRSHTAGALGLSFIYWFLALFRMWLVFLALGQTVSFPTIGLAITIGLILHAIPIPGGLGVVEGVYIIIFTSAGIPEGAAFTAAILDRGISFWFTTLLSTGGIAWSSLELSRVVDR